MWFGKNLRYLRLKAGLSQDSIGDLVGKKFTTIQSCETAINESGTDIRGSSYSASRSSNAPALIPSGIS